MYFEDNPAESPSKHVFANPYPDYEKYKYGTDDKICEEWDDDMTLKPWLG
jgi:hypothetical protein